MSPFSTRHILTALVLFGTGTARAQGSATTPQSSITGYVQLMSNYVGRGLAQSVGRPSAQTELAWDAPNGLYGFLDATSINWIDQLYPGDSVSMEVDAVVGYRHPFTREGVWKVGVMRLQFPGRYVRQNPPVQEPHTTELFARLEWKRFMAKLNVAVTDAFGTPDSKGSWYLDLSTLQPLGMGWSASAHLGRKETRGTNPSTGLSNGRSSYTDCKVALAYDLRSDLSLTLAETWTTADPALFTLNGYRVGGHHLALTLQKTF
jgi:uncharacterized protein (TIGR02001 family)